MLERGNVRRQPPIGNLRMNPALAVQFSNATRPRRTGPIDIACVHSRVQTGPVNDVTRILDRAQQGDPKAAEELLPLVYSELRRLAAYRLAGERRQQTLQPTALVHEAWLKLSGDTGREWNGRQHFFAAAAEAMRRILVDRARRRLAAKRGSGEASLDADELEIPAPAPDDQLLDVNDALEKFVAQDPRKAELVKLRYFVGMTFEEAAEALGIAVPTAKEWWAYARAWLRVEIAGKSAQS
jgi:RNA polymerase sigma factor (TIGR02999 family)